MIERTARNIKQPNAYVVDHIGKEELNRNLSLADVLHCESPDDVSDRWIVEYQLERGTTDVLDVDKTLTPKPANGHTNGEGVCAADTNNPVKSGEYW